MAAEILRLFVGGRWEMSTTNSQVKMAKPPHKPEHQKNQKKKK